jgi:hypothetical protein
MYNVESAIRLQNGRQGGDHDFFVLRCFLSLVLLQHFNSLVKFESWSLLDSDSWQSPCRSAYSCHFMSNCSAC